MIDNRKVLLLNSDYRALRFVTWERALRLMSREKVDIVSHWEDTIIRSIDGKIILPSTLRLKNHVRYYRKGPLKFSKLLIKKRDRFTCQYCGETRRSSLTIDHVIPKSRGGPTDYENCITACYSCNNKKNNRLLSETNMRLLNKPQNPIYDIYYGLYPSREQHPDWKMFLN